MVPGIFFISVVIKINNTFFGGSSRIFNNALKALRLSIWISSIIHTLYKLFTGDKCVFSINSLILSMPVFMAALISCTSNDFPKSTFRQLKHSLQGSLSLYLYMELQFSALATILDIVVFPTPCLPTNK